MSSMILQLNFKFNVPRVEYEAAVGPLADDFAQVPGLQWKVWLMNEADHEAGPALSDMTAKKFDVMDDLTAITRGPVGIAGAA
jgi:hypothetical protein